MRQAWLKIIFATIFLMAQMLGHAASLKQVSRPLSASDGAHESCQQVCCASKACSCSVAPSESQPRPVATPLEQRHHELKFVACTALLIQTVFAEVPPLSLGTAAPQSLTSHRPPPLLLHCVLLI